MAVLLPITGLSDLRFGFFASCGSFLSTLAGIILCDSNFGNPHVLTVASKGM
jgi:hypothetical protein